MRPASAAELTRKNLMDAFWRLYSERGKASVKDIAALAGYNRSTFYEYFTGTEDILRALEEDLLPIEPLHALQVRFLTEGMSLAALIRAFLPLLEGHLAAFAALAGPGGDLEFRERFFALWRPSFLARLRQGGMRADQAEIYGDFLISGMLGMIVAAARSHPGEEDAAVLAALAENWPEEPAFFAEAS